MPISIYNYDAITNLLQTKNAEVFQDTDKSRWSLGRHLQHRNLIAKVVQIFSYFHAYFPKCLANFYLGKVREIQGQYRAEFIQQIKAVHPKNTILIKIENQPTWVAPELYRQAFQEVRIVKAASDLVREFKPAFITTAVRRMQKKIEENLEPTETDLKAECLKVAQSAPASVCDKSPELALYELQDCIEKYIDETETVEIYLTQQDVINAGLPNRGGGRYVQTMPLREERLAAAGEYFLKIRSIRGQGKPFPEDLLLKLHFVGTIAALLKSFECPADYAKWALRHVFDDFPTPQTIATTLFRKRGDDFQTKEEFPWRMHTDERPEWLEQLLNNNHL